MATIHQVYWVEISKNPVAPFIVHIFVTEQRFRSFSCCRSEDLSTNAAWRYSVKCVFMWIFSYASNSSTWLTTCWYRTDYCCHSHDYRLFYFIYTFCSFVKQESSQICGGGAAAEVRQCWFYQKLLICWCSELTHQPLLTAALIFADHMLLTLSSWLKAAFWILVLVFFCGLALCFDAIR